ncbi:ATP-binding protein [Caulobacter sp. NIBR1757]|uniref:PAS domain-containing hybrid sensor histidine kinase/response regulator n=1 Tax=Caulobacter sp. NIBR1757 TaxID=3016000 RepID=UPI0022F04181|nr:ATP-binding protein [Caulobacter sp. NIBR1757]WGM40817.1 Sensor histidine kinase RcsC [Caulobacter sp. NIBR1757]
MRQLLDEGLDELAVHSCQALPLRILVTLGVGAILGLVVAPPVAAAWTAATLAFEAWSWFATWPQFKARTRGGRPTGLTQRANHFANLVAISGAWFLAGALFWTTHTTAGAICAVTVWLSLIGYGQAFSFQSPVGSLVSGGLPAAGMLIVALAAPIPTANMAPVWMILAIAVGFGAAGFKQMMTSRRSFQEAQDRLAASEAGYRLLADNVTDVISRHAPEGGMTYISPSARRVFGWDPEDIIGKARDNIRPDDMPRLIGAITTARQTGEPQTIDYRIIHADGREIWVESSLAPLEDGELVMTSRDITARKALEQDLVLAARRAESSGAAKADFLANMTHELRTPLTAIIGFSEVLGRATDLAPDQSRHVALIREASDTLLGIVNSVLDYSKLEAGGLEFDRQPFDPAVMASSVLGMVEQQAAAKGLRLTLDAADAGANAMGGLLGDGPRLGQVLLNFLSNAVKFTACGGVHVKLTRKPRGELQRLRVEVRDTGPGIAPGKIAALFERFTQADATISRQYGGTGLGLAIARRIIEGMDGRISASSRPGQGSTFWFELDLPAADLAPALEAPAARDLDRPLRLLLVEDNPVNRELVAAFLAPFDVEITEAHDGLQGLTAVRDGAFDLVLMDVQMPVMDGLTATRAIRALPIPQPPIIAMTANVLPDQIQRCLDAGLDDHLGKPINTAALLACLDRWSAPDARAQATAAA